MVRKEPEEVTRTTGRAGCLSIARHPAPVTRIQLMDIQPSRCLVCRRRETLERYECDEYEMDTLVHEMKIRNAAKIQRKDGSVPICESCWEELGFRLEEDEPAALSPLVPLKLGRRTKPEHERKE